MNYRRIYEEIIENAKCSNRKKGSGIYYEKHHIIPRCMDGTDDPENLVLLTAREHFICHQLLIEIYPDNSKLAYALWAMCNQKGKGQSARYTPSSRIYEISRILVRDKLSSRIISLETRRKIGDFSKNRIHSAETRKKISSAVSGKRNGFYGKTHSIEWKEKMSKSQSGKIIPDYIRKKISVGNSGKVRTIEMREKYKNANLGENNSMYGKYGQNNPNYGSVRTPEQKENIKIALFNLEIIQCPHCTIQSKSRGNMKRWHFNNCKTKDV